MRGILLILFIATIIGCANNTEVPKDIIPQARMEKILWDMLVADRFVSQYVDRPGDTIKNTEEAFKVYQKVFNIHGITRDEFLKSYKFYLSRPDITRTVFDSIAAQAERKRTELYAPKTDSLKKKADSLKNRTDSVRNRIDSLKRKFKK